jgi:ABC-type multidrug transport system fused ATPase/permease subunit
MARTYGTSQSPGKFAVADTEIHTCLTCISSLRQHIGVVPQDPTLFNDSVMNNIRYSKIQATDEEVYEACKAAAIHDKIMSFPDGRFMER